MSASRDQGPESSAFVLRLRVKEKLLSAGKALGEVIYFEELQRQGFTTAVQETTYSGNVNKAIALYADVIDNVNRIAVNEQNEMDRGSLHDAYSYMAQCLYRVKQFPGAIQAYVKSNAVDHPCVESKVSNYMALMSLHNKMSPNVCLAHADNFIEFLNANTVDDKQAYLAYTYCMKASLFEEQNESAAVDQALSHACKHAQCFVMPAAYAPQLYIDVNTKLRSAFAHYFKQQGASANQDSLSFRSLASILGSLLKERMKVTALTAALTRAKADNDTLRQAQPVVKPAASDAGLFADKKAPEKRSKGKGAKTRRRKHTNGGTKQAKP